MLTQLIRFSGVGIGALLVHWLVVIALVPLGMAPLLANVVGFMVAFNVSYFGHRHLTFEAIGLQHSQTLPRFAGVALLSFAVNETLYALLLGFTSLGYDLALLLVLATVAALTYLLSRFWAFAR